MMRWPRSAGRAGAGAAVLAALGAGGCLAQGCGGDTSVQSLADAGPVCDASVPEGDGATGSVPAANPDAGPPADAAPVAFAVQRFYFGETDWDGKQSAGAWEQYGLNLDGLMSTYCSVDHCGVSEPPGIGVLVKADGIDGIDNSFGANLVTLLEALFGDSPSNATTDAVAAGKHSLLFRLNELGSAPNQNGIPAAALGGGARSSPPMWDGKDIWPVAYGSVADGDLGRPNVAFPASYVSGDKWVSGAPPPGVLVVRIDDKYPWPPIRIHDVVVKMNIVREPIGPLRARGVIAGIADPQEVIDDLALVLGTAGPLYCSQPEILANEIRKYCDIMHDGTNGNAELKCDAISVGIGFDAVQAEIGAVTPPEPPIVPTPCTDGGAGDGG